MRFAMLWLGLLAACGGGEATVDSGPALDGGSDAQVALCGSDTYCDDRLYCTGTERCLPGEPGARPDGCVAGTSPCALGTVCNEGTDRCDVDDCSEPDADGDGDDRISCGGSDCDDGDVMRSGRLTEVCDAVGRDEDCNSSTLYNTTSRDGDVDGDLHAASRCFNQLDGGGENRGDDCDDMDGAVYDGAPERCNGIDDDCDAMRDEDFDCVQSTPAVGDNDCGHEGMRRCSDTCEWQDTAFYVAESAATCDYCDDSGMGLGQELPFTSTADSQVDSSVRYGSARWLICGALGSFWDCTTLTQTANAAGGAYQSLQVGHGAVTIRQSVLVTSASASPTEGWALVLLDAEDPSTTFVGLAAQGGIPTGRRGLAQRHRFSGTDIVELLDLRGASPRLISQGSGVIAIGGMSGVAQSTWLEVEITPDDPETVTDETAVTGTFPRIACSPLPSCLQTVSCSNRSATPCGMRVVPGSTWWLGITAGSTTAATTVEMTFGSTISREGVCE